MNRQEENQGWHNFVESGRLKMIMRNKGEELITVEEAAKLLCCHVKHVYRLIAEGKLPRVKFGRRWVRVKRSDVIAFIENHYGKEKK